MNHPDDNVELAGWIITSVVTLLCVAAGLAMWWQS